MGFKTGSFISVGNRGLNPTISLSRTRRVENPLWNFTVPHTFQGTVAGYASNGTTNIDKFPFATNANATDVGNSTRDVSGGAGQSSTVSGYVSGGGGFSNVIDKFPFASNGNATDVGDLTRGRYESTGQSSDVSGYTSGGYAPTPNARVNIIDKFPFSSDANATDVGDLTRSHSKVSGQSSTVSGYTSGGGTPSPPAQSNIIDKFPFATNANATDVGDLTVARFSATGQSSDVSGYTSGGFVQGPTVPTQLPQNTIDKFPFATNANATDVGDLTLSRRLLAGQSSTVSGYTSGGLAAASNSNVIDKFPFATDANATDVGDLTVINNNWVGTQD